MKLEIGKIYTDGDCYFEVTNLIDGYPHYKGNGVRLSSKAYVSYNCFSYNNITIREASYDESQWVKRCIKKREFIPFEGINYEIY